MPTYTVINKTTGEHTDHFCNWEELQDMLKTDPNLTQKLNTPGFVSDHMSTLRRAGDGWSDVLKGIKKGAGSKSTISNFK